MFLHNPHTLVSYVSSKWPHFPFSAVSLLMFMHNRLLDTCLHTCCNCKYKSWSVVVIISVHTHLFCYCALLSNTFSFHFNVDAKPVQMNIQCLVLYYNRKTMPSPHDYPIAYITRCDLLTLSFNVTEFVII
jgi:hypothetical protein